MKHCFALLFILSSAALRVEASEPMPFPLSLEFGYVSATIYFMQPDAESLNLVDEGRVRKAYDVKSVIRDRTCTNWVIDSFGNLPAVSCEDADPDGLFFVMDLKSESGTVAYLSDGSYLFTANYSECYKVESGFLDRFDFRN